MLSKGTFVLGGAASGKSVWAENLILSSDLNPVYLATGAVTDAEVKDRVEIHQKRRKDLWHTIEEPRNLSDALSGLTPETAVLIDCATMWLSNHMLAESDLGAEQEKLIKSLSTCAAPWVVVSNEVGHGIVPSNALARKFREAQGRLNIALAAQAECAVMVVAGLPQVLKGTLP